MNAKLPLIVVGVLLLGNDSYLDSLQDLDINTQLNSLMVYGICALICLLLAILLDSKKPRGWAVNILNIISAFHYFIIHSNNRIRRERESRRRKYNQSL